MNSVQNSIKHNFHIGISKPSRERRKTHGRNAASTSREGFGVSRMKVHFSSQSDDWATPQDFFDKLNNEFHFNLDPAASKENAKCKRYYSSRGLEYSWDGYRVFCNPPYGREIGKWVKKGSEAMGGDSGDVATCTNGYKILSPIYLRQSRNSFYQRSIEIWRFKELCTISKYGGNF